MLSCSMNHLLCSLTAHAALQLASPFRFEVQITFLKTSHVRWRFFKCSNRAELLFRCGLLLPSPRSQALMVFKTKKAFFQMFIYLNSRKPASTIHYNTSKGKALLPQEQLIPVFRDYEIFKSYVQNKKFFIFSVHAVYNLHFQSFRSVFFLTSRKYEILNQVWILCLC